MNIYIKHKTIFVLVILSIINISILPIMFLYNINKQEKLYKKYGYVKIKEYESGDEIWINKSDILKFSMPCTEERK